MTGKLTQEAGYCVVPGQDAKAKPMLERIAAELISATEGLAEEERPMLLQEKIYPRMYFNLIVTTARLKVCRFDPNSVSIDTGTLKDADFIDVPYVRFRKQLSTREVKWPLKSGTGSLALMRAKENTVFMVNSGEILSFLRDFEVDDRSLYPFYNHNR